MIDTSKIPGLTPARTRDLEMILPFIENGAWVTSISLAKMMRASGDYRPSECANISTTLSTLYNKTTGILQRKEKRRIYFHNVKRNPITTWAYRLNPNLIKEWEASPGDLDTSTSKD